VAGRWWRPGIIGVIVRTTRRGIVFNPRSRRGATAVAVTFIIVAAERNRRAFPVMGARAVTARRGESPVVLIHRRITAAG
jgi:hypothetical protein